MNERERVFEYMIAHGVDDYALKIMLNIRRHELVGRRPYFRSVDISEVSGLLSVICSCDAVAGQMCERIVTTDKNMLCALLYNIVNRIAVKKVMTECADRYITISLFGDFHYAPNDFERTLFKKLRCGLLVSSGKNASRLTVKIMRSNRPPCVFVSAEDELSNPLSDAYVFCTNL